MSAVRATTRKLVVAVILMVITGFAPAIILGVIGWSGGVAVALLAGMGAFVACMLGNGWRTGLTIAVPFAVLAGLTTWVAPNPWLAALVMAVAAFLRGYAAKAGLHDALMSALVALGFLVSSPPQPDSSMPVPLFVGLITLGTTLWVTFVIYLLRHRLHPHELTKIMPIRVLAYSVVLALLVGVATWFVVDRDLGHTGGWIILTIVVIFQPSLGAGFRKALSRAAGTVLGFVIAIIVGWLLPSGPLIPIAGSVFLMASFIVLLTGRPYWLFTTFLTPAIVLLESTDTTVTTVAEARLGATMVAVAGTMIVMVALSPLAKHFEATRASA